MIKKIFLIAAFVTTVATQAHNVLWWDILWDPLSPLTLNYNPESQSNVAPYDWIGVVPESGEPCIVHVTLDALQSPFITAVVDTNDLNTVNIRVTLNAVPTVPLDKPIMVTGEWHATGVPENKGCDGKSRFSVPVMIKTARWQTAYNQDARVLTLNAWKTVVLQESCSYGSGWVNTGIGKVFMLDVRGRSGMQLYRDGSRMGGTLWGRITAYDGSPIKGAVLGLPDGGGDSTSGSNGDYVINVLGHGDNKLELSWPYTYMDLEGKSQRENLGLEFIQAMLDPYVSADVKVDGRVLVAPGWAYVGWYGLGLVTMNNTQRRLYYNYGVRSLNNSSRKDSGLKFTVTTSSGEIIMPTRPGGEPDYLEIDKSKLGLWNFKLSGGGSSVSSEFLIGQF